MLCINPSLLRGKSGLTRTDLALLAYIIEHPDEQGTRSEIADDCDCAANSIPRSAKKLEARGLIERVIVAGRATKYRAGRNIEVTTSNDEVTCNIDDTTGVTPELRATHGGAQTETTTTDGVVTDGTGGRNIPPPHPPNNNTTLSQTSSETEELGGEGGLGGGFALDGDEPAKPKRARRKKHPSFTATDETLPRELTREMREIATEAKLINGTCDEQFAQWRRYHIREQTVMTFVARSWQTWVNNWVRGQKRDAQRNASGKRQILLGDGRVAFAKRHQPTMRAPRVS